MAQSKSALGDIDNFRRWVAISIPVGLLLFVFGLEFYRAATYNMIYGQVVEMHDQCFARNGKTAQYLDDLSCKKLYSDLKSGKLTSEWTVGNERIVTLHSAIGKSVIRYHDFESGYVAVRIGSKLYFLVNRHNSNDVDRVSDLDDFFLKFSTWR